ncbi:MAG TPA: S4 domain-containing protein YaaA [Bacilli bacterium]|nr:S4 domain-containing protein YaaA [Bacilli bacterium]
MATQDVYISSEEITLGQFLKHADIIDSGGMTKWFLAEHEIKVNGEFDNRRGRKLRPGDRVEITDIGAYRLHKEA